MNESTDNEGQAMPSKQPVDEAVSLGLAFLEALFTRHQIAANRRTNELASILGLEWHAASRRWSGVKRLTFDELALVAQHFGEELSEALQQKLDADGLDAVLVVGDAPVACKLWLGELLGDPAEGGDLVATFEAGVWNVAPRRLNTKPGDARKVQRIVVNSAKQHKWRVAVLDDKFDQAADLCAFFAADGLAADAYTTINKLEAALHQRQYDAYVLDWLIDREVVSGLISRIRSSDRTSPIAILTGQIATQRVAANDLELAAAEFDLHLFEKPTSLAMITARLKRLLGAVERRG